MFCSSVHLTQALWSIFIYPGWFLGLGSPPGASTALIAILAADINGNPLPKRIERATMPLSSLVAIISPADSGSCNKSEPPLARYFYSTSF